MTANPPMTPTPPPAPVDLDAANRALRKMHDEKWRERERKADFLDAKATVLEFLLAQRQAAEVQQKINAQLFDPETSPDFDAALIELLCIAVNAVEGTNYDR